MWHNWLLGVFKYCRHLIKIPHKVLLLVNVTIGESKLCVISVISWLNS